MYSERIPDERITASSWLSSEHLPYYGRLGTNIGQGSWCAGASDTNLFLEIDLGMEHLIKGIITEGKHRLSSDQLGEAWVTEFSISFTTTREQWNNVTDVQTHQPIVSINSLFAPSSKCWQNVFSFITRGSKIDAVVRERASHKCGLVLTPGPGVICGLSFVGSLIIAPTFFH